MGQKALHLTHAVRRIADYQDRGARITGRSTAVWDVARKCERPVHVEHVARPAPIYADRIRSSSGRLTVEMSVPCRTCPACLRSRAARWRHRSLAETASATRTWFGTLTVSPGERFKALSHARYLSEKDGIDFESLDEAERFAVVTGVIQRQVTLWLKRVRKNSGALVRYINVVEAHKDGWPHFHCLVHQCDDRPVTYRHLSDAWGLGFTKFNLVTDPRAARYVTKYLSKSILSRVRASLKYGHGASNVLRHSETCPPERGKGGSDLLSHPKPFLMERNCPQWPDIQPAIDVVAGPTAEVCP